MALVRLGQYLVGIALLVVRHGVIERANTAVSFFTPSEFAWLICAYESRSSSADMAVCCSRLAISSPICAALSRMVCATTVQCGSSAPNVDTKLVYKSVQPDGGCRPFSERRIPDKSWFSPGAYGFRGAGVPGLQQAKELVEPSATYYGVSGDTAMSIVNSISSPPMPLATLDYGGFQPEFFQVRPVAQSAFVHRPEDPDADARVSYRADIHGSHAEFRKSSDFPAYTKQVRENLDFLAAFCRENRMPDAEKIAKQFNTFFNKHIVTDAVWAYADLLDSCGKQSMDNFCEMVRDEQFRLEPKMAAIRNLSDGITACDSGVTSNLIYADRELALSAQGIRGALWKIKETVVRNVVQQAVSAKFKQEQKYLDYEVHYVNAVWNYIEGFFGLGQILDSRAPRLDPDFLDDCKEKVQRAMTPDRLVRGIAEQYVGMFTSWVAGRKIALSGNCTPRVTDTFVEALEEVRHAHSVEEGRLTVHAFVWLDEEGQTYRVRTDPSLVGRQVFQTLDAEGLLQIAPRSRGSWEGEDGARYALMMFGTELAWRAREDDDADVELLAIRDLVAWRAQGENSERQTPPVPAIRQALGWSQPDERVCMPPDWLPHLESPGKFLLGPDKVLAWRYLEENRDYFLFEFPGKDRATLIDEAMGVDGFMRQLACAWYPDAWKLLMEVRDDTGRTRLQHWMARDNGDAIDVVRGIIEREWRLGQCAKPGSVLAYWMMHGVSNMPALQEAMEAGNANAISAWHRLLRSAAVFDAVRNRLPELLSASTKHGPALAYALDGGHAAAIKAYHGLLADSEVMPYIRTHLPSLLTAASPTTGVPSLVLAMQAGRADAVAAFHAMLLDTAILPHVVDALQDMLLCRAEDKKRGILTSAIASGDVEVVKAFRALLTDLLADPVSRPRIAPHLLTILKLNTRYAYPVLTYALFKGSARSIEAYGQLFTDPEIVSHIKEALPDLLAAKGSNDTPGLAYALEHGHTRAIEAFHELLAHPNILEHIAHALPDLLFARLPTGGPGLALALRNGHGGAVRAYHAILSNEKILPYISKSLPELLIGRRENGTRGLLAVPENKPEATTAYLSMLADSRFAPHIGDWMADMPWTEDPRKPVQSLRPVLSPSTDLPPTSTRRLIRRVLRRLQRQVP
jgi:hypothetical protein